MIAAAVADKDATIATLQADLATAQADLAAATAPANVAYTSSGTDTLIGTAGNDTFTGSSGDIDANDQIIDSSATDADVANLTIDATSSLVPQIASVETINVDIQALGATITLDTASITGNTALNITRTDPTIGGTTLNGGDNVTVDNVDSANTPTININSAIGVLTVNHDGATADGTVINAATMTGNITVTGGAATINAAATTGDLVLNDEAGQVNATPVVINTAAATDIDVGLTQAYDGPVTVNAAAADTVQVTSSGVIAIDAANANTVDVNDATGGATVTAGSTSAADTTITLVNVDASGATVTTGTGVAAATASAKQIDVTMDGTALATDTATVSGAGVISLEHDAGNGGVVEILNFSGNGAEVTYDFDSADALGATGSITGTGSHAVNVILDADVISGATVSGIDELTIDAKTTDANIDLDSVTVGKYIVTADLGASNNDLDMATGQTLEFTTNQTAVDIDVAGTTTDTVSIIAGDVNGSSSTVGTLSLGAVATTEGTANSATTGDTRGGTVTFTANDANLTMAGLTAWSQNVVITGDEDVTLSTATTNSVSSQGISAAGLTGNLTVTIAHTGNVANTASVTAGSGDDNIDIETGTGAITVDAGAGADTITLTSVGALATINANEGNDTIEMDEDTGAYVVLGGAGDDTYDFGSETGMNATIVDSAGADDTILLSGASMNTYSEAFSMSGIEVFQMGSNNFTLNAAQFANNNAVALEGSGTFTVNAAAATAATIDASNLTMGSAHTVSIVYSGDSGADVITGGGENETIDGAAGADTLTGGAGTDTLDVSTNFNVTETGSANASTGVVVNLGSTALTNTSIYTNVADYIAGGLSSVASGQVAHLYAADLTTNSAVIDTVSGFENVTGSAGADYIVGDSGANNITTGAGADYIVPGLGNDTVTLNNVANIKSTISKVIGFTSTDNIAIQATAAGQFADLHNGGGTAFTGAATGAVVTFNVQGGAAALGSAGNVINIDANSANLALGYAAFTNLNTALDTAVITKNGGGNFADGDEVLIVWHNTTASAYEVGIMTIAGGDGINGGDETYEGLLQVDTTGVTQAQVAAAIDYIA